MELASINARLDAAARLIRTVVPADVIVTVKPDRIQVGRAGESDFLLVLSDGDRFIEVIRPAAEHRLGILELASVVSMLRRNYEDTDVAAYAADDWTFGPEAAAQRGAEPADGAVRETFICRECGEEHPVIPGPEDSLWCDCGARLDDQRARIADAAL